MNPVNATSLYVSACRSVLQCDPRDPRALAELCRLLPFFRQSLSCLVCGNLLQDPIAPTNSSCQHYVCQGCKGQRMQLKPSCSWCKDYSCFEENRQLSLLVHCYRKLCLYIAQSPLAPHLASAANDSPDLQAILNEGLSLAEREQEGEDFSDSANQLQTASTSEIQPDEPPASQESQEEGLSTVGVNGIHDCNGLTNSDTLQQHTITIATGQAVQKPTSFGVEFPVCVSVTGTGVAGLCDISTFGEDLKHGDGSLLLSVEEVLRTLDSGPDPEPNPLPDSAPSVPLSSLNGPYCPSGPASSRLTPSLPQENNPHLLQSHPQPSTLIPQPRTLTPQPRTLIPQPRTLTPQPRTLTPQPRTLTPQPCTLIPQPRTLTPQPRTLTPQPRTLTPQPRTLTPQPRTLIPQPRTVVSQPCTVVSQPCTVVPQPHTVVPQPHTVVPQPHTVVPQPHTVVPQPHTVVPQPHTGVPQPHTVVSQPHTVVSQPHTVVSQPHTGVPQPHTVVPQPHTGVSQPHTVVPQPHTVVPQPHTVVPQPHTVVPQPHTVVPQPHTVVPQPHTVVPQSSTVVPQSSTVVPRVPPRCYRKRSRSESDSEKVQPLPIASILRTPPLDATNSPHHPNSSATIRWDPKLASTIPHPHLAPIPNGGPPKVGKTVLVSSKGLKKTLDHHVVPKKAYTKARQGVPKPRAQPRDRLPPHPHSHPMSHPPSPSKPLYKKPVEKKGCKCGRATQNPSVLTCRGQRCPCYSNRKACLDCICRGCQNSYMANGEKKLEAFAVPEKALEQTRLTLGINLTSITAAALRSPATSSPGNTLINVTTATGAPVTATFLSGAGHDNRGFDDSLEMRFDC